MKAHAQRISDWLKNYTVNARQKGLVIGVSGGVDSGLVSTLCAMTGLPVYPAVLPCESNPAHGEAALRHINWLQENFPNVQPAIEIDLTDTFRAFKNTLNGRFCIELADANTKSRLRMVALYQIACCTSSLVVGTGNKVEDFGIGFFTKYGDGGVDISPIGHLLKSEVRAMSAALGVAREITEAIPTDGLWGAGHTDEAQIGASYDELEWAMSYDTAPKEFGAFSEDKLTERQQEVLKIYRTRHNATAHKMAPIPTFPG